MLCLRASLFALLVAPACSGSSGDTDPDGPDPEPTISCTSWDWQLERVDPRPTAGYGVAIAVGADSVVVSSSRAAGTLGDLVVATCPRAGASWRVDDVTATGSHSAATDVVVTDNVSHVVFH